MTAAQSALDALDRAHGKLDALEGRPVAPTVRIEPTPEAVLRALADLE